MIEIVKEPRKAEDELDENPRNVRQIGTLQGNTVVYIEDYVYRFLHSSSRKKERQVFVFLGEIRRSLEKKKIFIRGALELEEISFGGFMPVFSDDMWDCIYRQAKEYFPGECIVGWAMQSIGPLEKEEKDLEKISKRHFPEDHGNVLIYDAYGDWERMYVPENGHLMPQEGFFVYYEKNPAMSEYLNDYHARGEEEREQQVYPERFCVHDEARYQEEVRQDAEALARYRAYVNGQKQKRGGRSRVAVSIALVVLMLLSGILIQNYAKLADMQQTVETLSRQKQTEEQQQEKEGEDAVQDTIRKGAEELTQADGQEAAQTQPQQTEPQQAEPQQTPESQPSAEAQQAVQPSNQEAAAAATDNIYLQQGYYIVEQGDKLTDISRKVYGTEDKVQAICELNQIEDMDHIRAGDKLLLP